MCAMLDHNGMCHFGSSLASGSVNPTELVEDQNLREHNVEMASREAQEARTREEEVAAGLVLDEPSAPPSASVADVVNDLSNALERLHVVFDWGGGDKDSGDKATTEAHVPPMKKLKGFVAASQMGQAPETRLSAAGG